MPKSSKKPSITLDPKKVLQDLSNGRTQSHIAQKYGVNDMAVSRFVKKIKDSVGLNQDLDKTRSQALSILHGESLSVLSDAIMLLRQYVDKDVELVVNGFPGKLALPELMQIMKAVGTNQAVIFDKMRLEKGQSTENVGLAGMVMHFHDKIGVIDPKTGELRPEIAKAAPKDLSEAPPDASDSLWSYAPNDA